MTTSPDRAATEGGAVGVRARLRSAALRFWDILKGGAATPLRTSMAFGLGLAIAFTLPPGTHTPAALGLAVLLRLNGVLAVAGTLVWQPFTAPLILFAQKRIGLWLLGESASQVKPGFWSSWAEPVLVGAPLSALLAGAAGTATCYGVLMAWRTLRPATPAPPPREEDP